MRKNRLRAARPRVGGAYAPVGVGIRSAAWTASGHANAAGPTDQNSYFTALKPYVPGEEPLGAEDMRICFLGSWYSPRLAQACNSVFIEVGGGPGGTAADQFVFDCGSGVVARYFAMGIPLSRMDKIFLTHLHADHMSDLTHIYCFGPAYDRKTPLYVWGPTKSNLTYTDPDGNVRGPYDDGTRDYCGLLREAACWHSESFSFQTTAFADPDYRVPAWSCPNADPTAPPKDLRDAYELVSFELDWTKEGQADRDNVAYYNPESGVTITHFPAVHARQGSISYKLEWKGLSVIFTGDTKPNNYVVRQATHGVDVLIHEMTPSPEVWVEKFTGLQPGDDGYEVVLEDFRNVQDSSHTEQKMFGYILSLLEVPPRVAVGTHFPATDDTIRPALEDIRRYYPEGDVTVATDLMVINVSKKAIEQRRAVVSDYVWAPPSDPAVLSAAYETPKYWTYGVDGNGNQIKVGDPYAQLDPQADVIAPPDDYDER